MEVDELVAQVEYEKVLADILAEHSGVITKYFAEPGDYIDVGSKLYEIDTDAKAPVSAPDRQSFASVWVPDNLGDGY